jgi:hypothetical protein
LCHALLPVIEILRPGDLTVCRSHALEDTIEYPPKHLGNVLAADKVLAARETVEHLLGVHREAAAHAATLVTTAGLR